MNDAVTLLIVLLLILIVMKKTQGQGLSTSKLSVNGLAVKINTCFLSKKKSPE